MFIISIEFIAYVLLPVKDAKLRTDGIPNFRFLPTLGREIKDSSG